MIRYKATIKYKVNDTHPDLHCITDWTPDKVFEYEDVYRFDSNYWDSKDTENMKEYMQRDLSIIAGGGYNARHIYDVWFEFKRITAEQEEEWRQNIA